jgi:hypothetical protein
MLKLMFMPFRLIGGLLAGALAKRLFERIWSLIDRERVPDSEQPAVPLKKLVTALVLEGAVFRAVRGLVDHGARVAFFRLTGRWPGEQRSAREQD